MMALEIKSGSPKPLSWMTTPEMTRTSRLTFYVEHKCVEKTRVHLIFVAGNSTFHEIASKQVNSIVVFH